MSDACTFGGGTLDRAATRRADPAWVQARQSDDSARFLPLWDLRPLASSGEPASLGWLTGDDLPEPGSGDEVVFLGLEHGEPRFAIPVGNDAAASIEEDGRLEFINTRSLAATAAAADAGTAAEARSLLAWHRAHRFCASCGHPSELSEAGWSRLCRACGTRHFPRTDPVVIMVIYRGPEVLLGRSVRSPRYPAGLHSCLAGYVEPAETIETAVRRESLEEAGIPIGRVTYVTSQPWPFPSTLMIGCYAEALATEIRIDRNELESARWFDRQELARALSRWEQADVVRLPPPFTIAHQLVRAWIEESDR